MNQLVRNATRSKKSHHRQSFSLSMHNTKKKPSN